MEEARPVLTQMTLAVEHVADMVAFYNAVFAADLQPMTAYGTILYQGQLHGLSFLLCPNSVAGVQAMQNRHQFTYTVPDLMTTIERTRQAGGRVAQQATTTATILDPDGNSIVFQQA